MRDDIATRPGITGHSHSEIERCAYCGRVHPATLRDADVRWCDGVFAPYPRWLIVELDVEAVAA